MGVVCGLVGRWNHLLGAGLDSPTGRTLTSYLGMPRLILNLFARGQGSDAASGYQSVVATCSAFVKCNFLLLPLYSSGSLPLALDLFAAVVLLFPDAEQK